MEVPRILTFLKIALSTNMRIFALLSKSLLTTYDPS